MRYQLASVLAQVKHLRRVQVLEQGLVQEWVLRLEKELELALEGLQREQVLGQAEVAAQAAQRALVQAEAQVEVLEPQELQSTNQQPSWYQPSLFETQEDFE